MTNDEISNNETRITESAASSLACLNESPLPHHQITAVKSNNQIRRSKPSVYPPSSSLESPPPPRSTKSYPRGHIATSPVSNHPARPQQPDLRLPPDCGTSWTADQLSTTNPQPKTHPKKLIPAATATPPTAHPSEQPSSSSSPQTHQTNTLHHAAPDSPRDGTAPKKPPASYAGNPPPSDRSN